MTRLTATVVTIAIVAILILGVAICGVYANGQNHYIPKCAEDVVLVGTGDYQDGRWDSLTCGPARDDYKEAQHGTTP